MSNSVHCHLSVSAESRWNEAIFRITTWSASSASRGINPSIYDYIIKPSAMKRFPESGGPRANFINYQETTKSGAKRQFIKKA